MERFAFVIHPIDVRTDVARKFPFAAPLAARLPISWLETALQQLEPMVVAHLVGIRSHTGVEAEGWFIGCPLGPEQLLSLPYPVVLKKLERCAELAHGLGAKVMGLGALTSVAGDGGIELAKRVPIAITTGNSYTVATAVEGAKKAAALMDTPIDEAHVAIVGAAGSIGRTSALLLGRDARKITLIGRNRERLDRVAAEVSEVNSRVFVADNVEDGLRDADVIVTVTSAADAVIEPRHLKRGAVVCDVARPRDVSTRVARERDDVLVIEGGVVAVPGEMRVPRTNKIGQEVRGGEPFSFGFPDGTAYACMSETMMLALEKRYENFTLGKDVSVEQVEATWEMAARHGFQLAGFRSFEKAVTSEQIARIREKAGRALK